MTTARRSRAKSRRSNGRARRRGARGSGSDAPSFRELRAAESLRILRRNHVGRLAYTLHDRVEIQPIHYVTDGRWLYVRTSPGFKIAILGRNRWIAFQTDEVESAFSWRSVLVHGTAYTLQSDATPDLARRYQRAVRKIQELLPAAFTDADPVPFRTVVLGIHIERITGREAVAAGTARRGAAVRRRSPG